MSLPESELDDDDEDEDDDDSLELELELELSDSSTAMLVIFVTVFICSRSSSVNPPRPMDVKKLIANLVFFGLSRGNSPENAPCSVLKKRKYLLDFKSRHTAWLYQIKTHLKF